MTSVAGQPEYVGVIPTCNLVRCPSLPSIQRTCRTMPEIDNAEHRNLRIRHRLEHVPNRALAIEYIAHSRLCAARQHVDVVL